MNGDGYAPIRANPPVHKFRANECDKLISLFLEFMAISPITHRCSFLGLQLSRDGKRQRGTGLCTDDRVGVRGGLNKIKNVCICANGQIGFEEKRLSTHNCIILSHSFPTVLFLAVVTGWWCSGKVQLDHRQSRYTDSSVSALEI